MTTTGHHVIEDYIPIDVISAEARQEKSIRKRHISTLHLWWARRPLVACPAALCGALVPANGRVAGAAEKFVARQGWTPVVQVEYYRPGPTAARDVAE